MSQKANLLTIRKKNRFELITQNSKIWNSLTILVENISRLFLIKGISLFKSFWGFDTNLVSIDLFLFYQNSKISIYKRKIIEKKNNNAFSILRGTKGFLICLKKFISLYGYNYFTIKAQNLNLLVDKKRVSFLFGKLKMFSANIFTRRFNLFIDFIKITTLFYQNYIELSSYIKIWARIFRFLSKRLHSRFILFVKTVIKLLIEIGLKKKNLKYAISGIKFILRGRIRAKPRASSSLVQMGTTPVQSFNKNIDFAFSHVHTLYGVYGIKFWVYFKKN